MSQSDLYISHVKGFCRLTVLLYFTLGLRSNVFFGNVNNLISKVFKMLENAHVIWMVFTPHTRFLLILQYGQLYNPKRHQVLRSQLLKSRFSLPLVQRFVSGALLVNMFLKLHVFWHNCVFIFASFLKLQCVSGNGNVLGRLHLLVTVENMNEMKC